MTSLNAIPADAVLVAIDIAKVRNEVLIEAPNHKRRRRLPVLNNRAEHDRLIEILKAYGRSVICAFGATGNYHRPIAWRLAEAGFEVRQVSSLALARTREALHNSWDKNDPKDAQVILHMLRIQATQIYHDPLRAGVNDVQELSKTHEAIARAKTEIQHRILTHYLPLYFPEIDRFRGNSRSDWFFAFLDAFPAPASITVLTKEEFVKAAWDVVGRKVSKTQILKRALARMPTTTARFETSIGQVGRGPPAPLRRRPQGCFRSPSRRRHGTRRPTDVVAWTWAPQPSRWGDQWQRSVEQVVVDARQAAHKVHPVDVRNGEGFAFGRGGAGDDNGIDGAQRRVLNIR